MKRSVATVLVLLISLSPFPAVSDETTGMCSPIVTGTKGDVRMVIKCANYVTEFQSNLEFSIKQIKRVFELLHISQTSFFDLRVRQYENNQTDEQWRLLIEDLQYINEVVGASKQAILIYRTKIQKKETKTGEALMKRLEERRQLMVELTSRKDKLTGKAFDDWLERYRKVRGQTEADVIALMKAWDLYYSCGPKKVWPAYGDVVSTFAEKSPPEGLELKLPENAKIRATTDGTVASITMSPDTGITITIENQSFVEDYATGQIYGNLGEVDVTEGQNVKKFQNIGAFDAQRAFADKPFYYREFNQVQGSYKLLDPYDFLQDRKLPKPLIGSAGPRVLPCD
ncbi:peptidoglycan DD-metalloendopeptidase family protein [Rhizobium ruizarguesonis]